jgi:hypothetical protein
MSPAYATLANFSVLETEVVNLREMVDQLVIANDDQIAYVKKVLKGQKVKKDKDAPKRPISPYLVYCAETRPKIKEENPGIVFGKIAALQGKGWGALNDEDKEVFVVMAIAGGYIRPSEKVKKVKELEPVEESVDEEPVVKKPIVKKPPVVKKPVKKPPVVVVQESESEEENEDEE